MSDILSLIAQVETDISPTFGGDTTLSDPGTNQADPLVNLVTANLAGLVKLHNRLDGFRSGLSPYDAEGNDLDIVAQLMGTTRAIDLQSKVPVIVSGKSGATLPAATVLVDAKGNEWVTTSNAVINSYGWTNACSPVGGFDLVNGELQLKDAVDNITSATNSALPEIGGSYESDQSLRRRLLNIRPQWRVKETADALLYAIHQVAGVDVARVITDLPECLASGCGNVIVGVLGGADADVAQSIYDNIYYSLDRLIGDRSFDIECTTIKWQPLCPVVVEVEYWLRCDCTTIDAQTIETQILNTLNGQSLRLDSLSASNLCTISDDLIDIKFRPIYPPQAGDCYPNTISNPVTGEDINYVVSDLNSLCYAELCGTLDEYSECLNITQWNYPIFLPEYITKGVGCPCPDIKGGCGCG